MGVNGGLYGLERLNQLLLKREMKPVESPSAVSLSAVSSRPNCSEPNGLKVERYDGIKCYTLI
jgi:hypothetical protein